jgi:hypothetical protein
MTSMTMKIHRGLANFTEQGIEIKPRFPARPLVIPWSNVMFICPTPYVKKQEAGWVKLNGEEPITEATLRDGQRFYSFWVALHDRDAVLRPASFFTRSWLKSSSSLNALLNADDKPDPANGYMSLDLNPDWVRGNGKELLSALDSIAAHSRFDMIVSLD